MPPGSAVCAVASLLSITPRTTGKDTHINSAQALMADAPCQILPCSAANLRFIAFMTLNRLLVQQQAFACVVFHALL